MDLKEKKYFQSPEEAVEIIRDLLIKEDWNTLSKYYCLKDSGINQEELLSGDFFMRKEQPEVCHPGGFWRYKHPFPPGFNYESQRPGKNNTVMVCVSIEINEGMGMIQRGYRYFKMIQKKEGSQILPEMVDSFNNSDFIL